MGKWDVPLEIIHYLDWDFPFRKKRTSRRPSISTISVHLDVHECSFPFRGTEDLCKLRAQQLAIHPARQLGEIAARLAHAKHEGTHEPRCSEMGWTKGRGELRKSYF